jgi:hypothetical protein
MAHNRSSIKQPARAAAAPRARAARRSVACMAAGHRDTWPHWAVNGYLGQPMAPSSPQHAHATGTGRFLVCQRCLTAAIAKWTTAILAGRGPGLSGIERGAARPRSGCRSMAPALLLGILMVIVLLSSAEGSPIVYPLEYDCPLKKFALAHSLTLLANSSKHHRASSWPRAVYDALQLGPLCDIPPPPTAKPTPPPPPVDAVPSPAIFVATNGSDDHGSGNLSSPFATVRRAVLHRRIVARTANSTVVLRGGHYFFNETLKLSKEDSGLTLANYPGEQPVLHGGVALTDLQWTPAGPPFPDRVQVASIAHLPLEAWDGMLADGKLLWRARFPDVPEFGRQLHPEGSVAVYTFTDRGVPNAHAAVQIKSLPCRPNSSFACYEDIVGGNSERFENRRGFCSDSTCNMGVATITPAASGKVAAGSWSHPETGVAMYFVGPTPTCVWWNSGSFIVGISNNSGPGPRRPPPDINISGFELRPQRNGVGDRLSSFNCTATASPDECVEQAARYCLLSNSCGGFSYADPDRRTPWLHPIIYSGGGPSTIPHDCGNTDWNFWCKLGRCGDPCRGDPYPPQPTLQPGLTLELGAGDWQASVSRKVATMPASRMYVENILEELTAPGEWFVDVPNQKLYLYPNGTLNESTQLVASTLITILDVQGDDISIRGLTFSSTRPTFMQRYRVPSNGDWAVYNGAAVVASDSSGLSLELCTFRSCGGNGIALVGANFGSTLRYNEFMDIGDSAMVAIGETSGIDGYSEPRSSNFTSVIGNFIHEIGLIGKQVSGWCQMLAANTLIESNVIFNVPRAAINFNDGYAGGHVVRFNLLFNTVRETSDHGPVNTWDRSPHIFPGPDGLPTMVPTYNLLYGNLIFNNGPTSEMYPIDHDDGSSRYTDTWNVLVYGGAKYTLGNGKQVAHNLYVFPDVLRGGTCIMDNSGREESFYQNQCLVYNASRLRDARDVTGAVNTFGSCDVTKLSETVTHTANNTYYGFDPNMEPAVDCSKVLMKFRKWQALGQEKGSVTRPLPPPMKVVQMATNVLASAMYTHPQALRSTRSSFHVDHHL